jgi:hypothetical protein
MDTNKFFFFYYNNFFMSSKQYDLYSSYHTYVTREIRIFFTFRTGRLNNLCKQNMHTYRSRPSKTDHSIREYFACEWQPVNICLYRTTHLRLFEYHDVVHYVWKSTFMCVSSPNPMHRCMVVVQMYVLETRFMRYAKGFI